MQLDLASALKVLAHLCKNLCLWVVSYTTVQCVTLLSLISLPLSFKAIHNEPGENHQCPEQHYPEKANPVKHRTPGQTAVTFKQVLELLLPTYNILRHCQNRCCQVSKGLHLGVLLLTTARSNSKELFKTSLT